MPLAPLSSCTTVRSLAPGAVSLFLGGRMGEYATGGLQAGVPMRDAPPTRSARARITVPWPRFGIPGAERHPERVRLVAGVLGATGFVLATVVLVPEHLLGIEVLPETWDALLDLGLLFLIGVLLIRRPMITQGEVAPKFTRGLLLGLVVAASVGSVAALIGLWLDAGPLVALVALTILALSALPLRAFISGRSDSVLFGSRDEPYRVLSSLGHRVEAAGTPDALLAEVVHTVSETLGLPFVGIELELHGSLTSVASVGTPGDDMLRFPLVHRGRTEGRLVVRLPHGRRLTPADHRLLHDLSAQIGSAAHAAQLVNELRRTNRRIIAARADERRRLRRDLHDDLGPLLAGIGVSSQAARNLIGTDDARTVSLLGNIAADSQQATIEVRRLIENLHPVLLDRLGLVDALRRKLDAVPTPPTTEIVVSGTLEDLPADVELAAYRIVLEAHLNVVRHAHARHCRIEIQRDDDLKLVISDDGRGIGAPPGVGLSSMTERAAELGGVCRIRPRRPRGTIVEATLPVVAS